MKIAVAMAFSLLAISGAQPAKANDNNLFLTNTRQVEELANRSFESSLPSLGSIDERIEGHDFDSGRPLITWPHWSMQGNKAERAAFSELFGNRRKKASESTYDIPPGATVVYARALEEDDESEPEGSKSNPYHDLQAAAYAAGPGGVIFVRQSPSEHVLDGGVALLENQQLLGLGPSVVETHPASAAARISNMTTALDGDAIRLAEGNVVSGVYVSGSARSGISGFGIGNAKLNNNRIENFNTSNSLIPTTQIVYAGMAFSGIYIETNASGELTFTNNILAISASPGVGLRLGGSAASTLTMDGNAVLDIDPSALGVPNVPLPYSFLLTTDESNLVANVNDHAMHRLSKPTPPNYWRSSFYLMTDGSSTLDATLGAFVLRDSEAPGPWGLIIGDSSELYVRVEHSSLVYNGPGVIDHNGGTFWFLNMGQNSILDVVFENNTLINSRRIGVELDILPILGPATSDRISGVIRNNVIDGTLYAGVAFDMSHDGTHTEHVNAVVEDNTISRVGRQVPSDGVAIGAFSGGSVSDFDVVIRNNIIGHSQQDGILVGAIGDTSVDHLNMIVEDNEISGTERLGVSFHSITSTIENLTARISRNRLDGLGHAGIQPVVVLSEIDMLDFVIEHNELSNIGFTGIGLLNVDNAFVNDASLYIGENILCDIGMGLELANIFGSRINNLSFIAERNHIFYELGGLSFLGDAPEGVSDIDFLHNRILGPDPEVLMGGGGLPGIPGVVARENWWGGDAVDVEGDVPIDVSNPLLADPDPSVTCP